MGEVWSKKTIHRLPKTGKSSFSNAKAKDGFRSKFEIEVANQLPAQAREEYESHSIPYTVERKYTPDFPIRFADTGALGYIEVKGRFTSADRTKMKLIRQQHPNIDIRFVFQENKRIRPGSSTRYLDWAEKNGFPAVIGEVPKSWLKK